VDEVFKALADDSRRLLLDQLNQQNGQTLTELCACLDMARQSVSKHLAVLEAALEQTTMPDSPFVYTTYISTTPQRLWQALTDPAFTSRYWNLTFDTDWAAGSEMTWHNHGVTIADPEQVVLESDPYRRLSYTWHTFTDELAARLGAEDGLAARWNSEPRSKVSFDIEQTDIGVKLTVVHDNLRSGGAVMEGISGGWPAVLSKLKTLLETEDAAAPLPAAG
jgi:uncharacterized protein YndB with AHSA1/START domain